MAYITVDAHQDLAWNMLTFGRDYTQTIEETRRRENGSYVIEHNGDTTISWQEYQRGRVAVVFATLFAAPARVKTADWDTQVYANAEEAYKIYSGHLDAYSRLFDHHPDKFTPILTAPQLEAVLEAWNQPDSAHPNGRPTGLVTLMEGADGVRTIGELEEWWERGVRVIGPAWMSTRYCGGTREPGPLTPEGHALLEAMADIGFTLDLSHMAWEAALEALDQYEGPIIASHANALKQVKNGNSNRFLTDEIIEGIIEHDGVIGVIPFNRFLIQGWKNSDPRTDCPLDMVAAQMDYICQIAGNARHVGFGTDFDGGFGLQQIPAGLNTIADLQQTAPLLEARGYSQTDIAGIFGGNWINTLRRTLPA
ncbi:MAG: membrane dipeptidase [Chloroflexi bacterium]|nr:membrane dipeptidase [Chloroflexota bacterium]